MKYLTSAIILFVSSGLAAQNESKPPKFLYGTELIAENVAVFRITAPDHDPDGIFVIQIDPNGKILEMHVGDVRETFEKDTRVVAALSAPEGGYKKLNGRVISEANPDYNMFMAWQPNAPVEIFDEISFLSYEEYSNIIQGQGLIANKRVVTKDNVSKGAISAVGIDRYNLLTFIHGITETTPLEFANTVMNAMPGMRSLMMTSIGPDASIGFITGSQYYYSIGNTSYVNTSIFIIK